MRLSCILDDAAGSLYFFASFCQACIQRLQPRITPCRPNSGIFGGNVQDSAVDPQNPDRIFAATYKGKELFLSVDGGTSWQPLEMENLIEGEDTFNEQSAYAVALAPDNPEIAWTVTNSNG